MFALIAVACAVVADGGVSCAMFQADKTFAQVNECVAAAPAPYDTLIVGDQNFVVVRAHCVRLEVA